MDDIRRRKLDHIQIALTKEVSMQQPTGFARYQFIHQALPELALEDISVETTFLGQSIGAPLLISGMTGGSDTSEVINRNLAEAAEELNLPMAVGSQRVIFDYAETRQSFAVVRQVAPHVPIYANLGAVQLNYGFDIRHIEDAVDLVAGNGIFLHLNPLQEVIQGGNTNFRGLLQRMGDVIPQLNFPVLIKEVGCGISTTAAIALAEIGVSAIDVSGAGGTSWAQIESLRAQDPNAKRLGEVFRDWGIPTTDLIESCRSALPSLPLIASGGIRSGLDAAKALALGADLTALAMPLLAPATRSSAEVVDVLKQMIDEIRVVMFLLGISNISDLKRSRHLLKECW